MKGEFMDKKIISKILNIRWELRNKKVPRKKWRHYTFQLLWDHGMLHNKPTETFTNCWDFLVEQDLI